MQTLRAAVIALTVLGLPPAATALTVSDIIALSKAGVPDVVLTALIDADRTIFTLGAEQILDLRHAGVSDAVVLKMISSRQEFEPARPPLVEAGPPPAVVAESAPPAPAIQTVSVPYFVPVPIFIETRRPDRHSHHHGHPSHHPHGDHDRADRADQDRRDRKRPLPAGTIRNGEFVR